MKGNKMKQLIVSIIVKVYQAMYYAWLVSPIKL